MPVAQPRKLTVSQVPYELYNPGWVGGGGLNRSINRAQLGLGQLWNIRNVEPTINGYSNINIGTAKQNSSRPVTAKLQAIGIFNSELWFVADGNFYTMSLSTGVVTLESAAAFSTSARIRHTIGPGSSNTTKLFLCDGTSIPKTWDGTTLSNITAFGSNILTVIATSHYPSIVFTLGGERDRASGGARVLWLFEKPGVNSQYILASDVNDGETYTAGATVTNAFFEILPIGDESATAGATLKRSGDNKETEQIVVYTARQAFIGQPADTPGTNRFGVFTQFSKDIGAINQECVINFLNDLFSLSARGIGQFTAVNNEINGAILEAGVRINSLIQDASWNQNFDKAFAYHCKERNTIWFTMPKDTSVTASYEGYTYPEIPNTLTIGYRYALRTATGGTVDNWYTREGPGWAWSCMTCNGPDVYLGSYFGDVYKAYEGNEYERNPSTPNAHAVITSLLETGDMNWTGSMTQGFSVRLLNVHWRVPVGLKVNFKSAWDGAETGPEALEFNVGDGTGASEWDVALWDVANWVLESDVNVEVTPPDDGRTLRLIAEWDSETDEDNDGNYISNHGILYGISGLFQPQDLRHRLRFK